nr:translation initiation factor IF-2-like [Taeniopygia guttata]
MERCPGCDAPSPTLPPSSSSEQPPRPPPRPFLFSDIFLQHPTPPARAGAIPIGRRPRPPLSAPLARDNVIGGNRSFLILARGKLHPALRWAAAAAAHPRRIPPGKLQDQERAGKTSGSRHREAFGAASSLPRAPASLLFGCPHPPFPGRPHPCSLGDRISPSRGPHSCSLGDRISPSRGPHPSSLCARLCPAVTHGSPGPGPPAEAALPTRPRRAWASARKRTTTMVSRRLWRRLCDPQPQRPCNVLCSVLQSPQQTGLKTIRYISMR